MKRFEEECAWIDAHSHLYEGPLHIRCVKQNIRRRYEASGLIKGDIFYVQKPGTIYKYLGMSHGAGWQRNGRVQVYWSPETGQLFHRDPEDYKARMAALK